MDFEQKLRFVLVEIGKYDENKSVSLNNILPNESKKELKEIRDELIRLDWAEIHNVSALNDHLKPTAKGRSIIRSKFKEFMTEYIISFVRQSASAPYLFEEADNFPQPPTTRDWELRITEMCQNDVELIKHPNDTFSLPIDRTRVVNKIEKFISGDIISGDKVMGDNVQDSSFRDFKPTICPPIADTKHPKKTKSICDKVLQYWWAYVLGVAVAFTSLAVEQDWLNIRQAIRQIIK
jgi:hypothetical protein